MAVTRGWSLGDSPWVWPVFMGWHVLEQCSLGRLPGVGVGLLEVGITLKIAVLLCIP